MKKSIFILALIVVATGGSYGVWRLVHGAAEDRPSTVPTTKAEVRDIEQTIEATGEVTPYLATEVKSEVSGKIARLHIKDGDEVEAGQLLAELDQTDLLGERDELQRNIESAKLRVDRTQRDWDRQKDLHDQGFVTDQAFQDAQTEFHLAENDLQVQQARLQTLNVKLDKTSIRAPHAGVVLNCSLTEGQVVVGATSVSQGTVLMNVADIRRLLIKVDINEVDVAKLTQGSTVKARFDSIPDVAVGGTITLVSPSAVLREKIRVFPIEIACEKADPRVRPGISADVTVPLSKSTGCVAVVVSSVFTDDAGKFVFQKKSSGFEKSRVVVGINDAQYVEIKEGLSAGDEISLMRPPAFAQERLEYKTKDAEEQRQKGQKGGGRMRGMRFM